MIQKIPHHLWHRFMRESGLRYVHNRWRYGANAPRPNERIWIEPLSVKEKLRYKDRSVRRYNNKYSGVVLAGDWDLKRVSILRSPKNHACRLHFIENVPWAETGIYDHSLGRIQRDGHIDRMTTLAEIKARYARIDALMRDIREEGRLRNADTSPAFERNGVLIHIDRNGEPVFGSEGFHRLALAQIAKLTIMPARLGLVHPDALKTDALQRFRKPPIP